MFVAHDPSSLTLITLIIAAVAVFFWRAVIKLAAIGTVVVVVLGFFEFCGTSINRATLVLASAGPGRELPTTDDS